MSARIMLQKKLSRKASVLIFTVGLLVISALTVGSVLALVTYQTRNNERLEIYNDELNAAEFAMNNMLGQISFVFYCDPARISDGKPMNATDVDTAILAAKPPTLANFTFSEVTVTRTSGDLNTGVIDSDPTDSMNGYPAYMATYDLTVRAKRSDANSQRLNHPGVKLHEVLNAKYTPLYIFGMFYNNELEVWPGPQFDMYGKVHTNGDLYLGANTGANYHESVTSAGQIYAGQRDPNSGQTGSGNTAAGLVSILDKKSGNLLSMLLNSSPVDFAHLASNWASTALNRWNNNVLDEHLGMVPLHVAIPDNINAHAMIEPANSSDSSAVQQAKFANQADLTITCNADGSNLTLTSKASQTFHTDSGGAYYTVAPSSTKNYYVTTSTSFYNNREGKTINMLQLDISKLSSSGVNLGAGLIYMNRGASTSSSSETAVRIINGSNLPSTVSGNFSVATDDPLYIQGDFNTTSDKPALLAGDSINILSNKWSDSANTSANHGLATASTTTTYGIFLSGNVPSSNSHYSGGAENFFRYNEDWNNITHKFRGSMLNLFASQVAVGLWGATNASGAAIYNAPTRDWGWDTTLNTLNSPPGMPRVESISQTKWELVN